MLPKYYEIDTEKLNHHSCNSNLHNLNITPHPGLEIDSEKVKTNDI